MKSKPIPNSIEAIKGKAIKSIKMTDTTNPHAKISAKTNIIFKINLMKVILYSRSKQYHDIRTTYSNTDVLVYPISNNSFMGRAFKPRSIKVEVIRETLGKVLSNVVITVSSLLNRRPHALSLGVLVRKVASFSHIIGLYLSHFSQNSVVFQRLFTYLASIYIRGIKYGRSGDRGSSNYATRSVGKEGEKQYREYNAKFLHAASLLYVFNLRKHLVSHDIICV